MPFDRPTALTATPPARQRVAVIGGGIAGLSAAWLLSETHEVMLFEADDRLGGHANTVMTPAGDAVDTGFLVYNRVTYPNLCALFEHLRVETETSDMSFSVSLNRGRLEYSGDGLNGIFGQRGNLLSPGFHRMLGDLVRFYRSAPQDHAAGRLDALSLGDYLRQGGYGERFARHHILPMGAAIWSSGLEEMLAFPAACFVRFFVNHGLFRLTDQPIWRTVSGGSRRYVEKLATGMAGRGRIVTGDGIRHLTRDDTGQNWCLTTVSGQQHHVDQVVLACHSDQALALTAPLGHAIRNKLLGRIRYQPNRAVLHTDTSLMPKRPRLWTSWNFIGEQTDATGNDIRASTTYWLNRLQNLPRQRPYFVSLNPLQEPAPASVIAEIDYAHPVFDANSLDAQRQLGTIQGADGLWFCGAWTGYGFHEDGLASGLAVAEALGSEPRPWQIEEASPAAGNSQPARTNEPVARA